MFFVVACYLFSKLTFSKYSFKNTIRLSNSLDPDQGPALGPNCLQRQTTKVATSKERVNDIYRVRVLHFQNPEILKLRSKNLQYAN